MKYEYRWAVFTAPVNIFKKVSRQGAKFMSEQEGFTQSYYRHDCSIFFYKDLNCAKRARNNAEYHGIQCGQNIVKFIHKDGELIFCDPDDEKGER